MSELATKVQVIAQLHADELQLILDELAGIEGELGTRNDAATGDPAASSPKRAKWLAEEERRAGPVSRRELLRGRGEDR